MSEKEIQESWGSPKEYYEEVRRFHEEHKRATYIDYHSEWKVPVRAVYSFCPLQAWLEHEVLKEAIRNESDKERGGR